ncbi:SLAM family member 7 [Choloepus didactylus]|uniref:SLAM family member 7 n=1 Tax=Choloepus didactylus TaxID=27675 RepID=UPI0018A0B837|nr:SLAM family member 7 [Choloepus didactylus]
MVGFPACFIRLSLLCQLTGSAASGALKELFGALGGSVTFPLELPEQPVDSIVWTFNSALAIIQPAGANESANVIVIQSRNKDRVSFLDRNYSLSLSQLRKNDSGAYRVEIHSLFQIFTQKYVLRVYEHLPKPQINVGLQTNENGTCMTNLSCSMEQEGEDVIYSWNSLGQTANEYHEGSILPITWRPEEGNVTFICMVRNPISCNLSNPISAWKLCEGAAGGKDTSVVFLYLLSSFFLLSLLVLGLVISIIKRERRKVSEIIEEKKGMDNHQEIPKFYPLSGENTEDYTIPHPNKTVSEDPVNTIYSIVQTPKKVEKPHSPSRTSDTPGLFIYEQII